MSKINWCLFSKDRATQLELLLRSTKEYFKEYYDTKINVLYTYSNDSFKEGYDKVKLEYPEINFIKERNFKKDVISLVDINNKYTIFFVDDQVFKETFEMFEIINFEKNEHILCVSLRLHPNMTYCYTANVQMTPIKNNVWSWRGLPGDYGYPMSLDSHVFLTQDILPYLINVDYKNPNSLESIISSYPINKTLMMCFDKSKTFNNPCNKVQTNNPNKHGNITAEYLNQEFLNGSIIDLTPFRGLNNESCHKEMPIKMIKKLNI